MDIQTLLNNPRAARVALGISRLLSPRLGHRLADRIAAWIASNPQTPMVQGLRANQWVIEGKKPSAEQLDQMTLAALQNIAYSFYTLFHYLEDTEPFQNLVVYSPQVEEIIARSQEKKHGLIALGVHVSSFDLILQAATRRGLRALALSLPQADEAVEWQHNYRRKAGVEILPASGASMRQAIQRLQAGETVLTGLDRPIPEAKYRPHFFGYPAHLPVHYIPLALKANVPLVVMAAIAQEDGTYHVLASDFIYLKSHSDRRTEIIQNAEMVLEAAEGFIRQVPRQWAIFQPAWPDLLPEIP